jgi:hypothetical protein
MTNDDLPNNPDHDDGAIPDLFEQLQPRVSSPDPADIRSEAARRGDVRRRTFGIAGAFIAILAIGAGALALTRDSTTSTLTADDVTEDVVIEAASDSSIGRRAVAEDSAPVELGGLILLPGKSIRDQLIGETWRVGAVHGDSQGFRAQSGYVMFNADPGNYGLPEGVDTVVYTTGCAGSAYEVEWASHADFSTDPPEFVRVGGNSFRVVSELLTVPISPAVSCVDVTMRPVLVEGSTITIGEAEGSNAITMGHLCPLLARCNPQGLWKIDLHIADAFTSAPAAPATTAGPPIRGGVIIGEQCANNSTLTVGGHQWLAWEHPPEWEGQDVVQVTVMIDDASLTATDGNGLTATFERNDGQARIQPCVGFTYEQPTEDTQRVVPDVRALLADSARQRLGAIGLDVLIDFATAENPDDVNRVLDQTPSPNSQVPKDSTVTIIVGLEPE